MDANVTGKGQNGQSSSPTVSFFLAKASATDPLLHPAVSKVQTMMVQTCDATVGFKVVLALALILTLTWQRTEGCQCPSCNYADAAQNCQCCVFRQLGKRSDPSSTFNLPNVHPFSTLLRHLMAPQSKNHNSVSLTWPLSQKSVAANDWSLEALPGHTHRHYRSGLRSSDTSVIGSGKPRPFSMEDRQPSGVSSNRMQALIRAVDNFNLAAALETVAEGEGKSGEERLYDYTH